MNSARTLNVCRFGHVLFALDPEVVATGDPRVDELIAKIFASRQRCAQCAIARLNILPEKVRCDLAVA